MIAARIVVGGLLLAHGLVHLLYLAQDVDAFSIESSRLPEHLRRPVALVLITLTVLAFALVAFSTWGVPGLSDVWPTLVVVASVLSAVLLLAFWDRQLVVGLVIDAVLILVGLWKPGWIHPLVPTP